MLDTYGRVDVLDFIGIDGWNKEGKAISWCEAPFTLVAKWRYEGWPTMCLKCEIILDIDDKHENWFIYHNEKNDTYYIAHTTC